MIDEKGRLFGKLNIVDLLVILVVLVAVVVLGVKFLGKDGGGGINPGKTQVTYTCLLYTSPPRGSLTTSPPATTTSPCCPTG